MVSVVTLSPVDHGPWLGLTKDYRFGPCSGLTKDYRFGPWLVLTKDYRIGICCFSTKNAALRSKSKEWLTSESG